MGGYHKFERLMVVKKKVLELRRNIDTITKSMFVLETEDSVKVYEQGNAIQKTVQYGSY
jgi:hypothetical protein